jgi:hypothetical protein
MRKLVVCLLLLAGLQCYAQTPLFRGREMREYNFPFNGHYYWSTREFVPGSVFFNGTLYENVPLNVNAHTQDLLARESSFAAPVVAERGLTAWFKIDGIYYYNLQYYGVEGAPEGFFQLLTDGRRNVWMQRRKLFARSPGDHNGDKGIGYDDPDYREKLNEELKAMRESEMWQAGATVRKLRPENN